MNTHLISQFCHLIPFSEKRVALSLADEAIFSIRQSGKIRLTDLCRGILLDKSVCETIINRALEKTQKFLISASPENDHPLQKKVYEQIEYLFNKIIISENLLSENLGLTLKEISRLLEHSIFSLFDAQLIQPYFRLNSEDFTTVGKDRVAYFMDGGETRCREFAFYHLHIRKAFKTIFHARDVWPDARITDQFQHLKSWGLFPVEIPQPGDLVIYGKTENGVYQNTHFGIFNESGRVTSKWGSYPVFDHEIDDVFKNYGNEVRFYRKKYRFTCQKNLIKKVKKVLNGLNEFGHSFCKSPLTPRGTLELLIDYFETKLIKDSDSSLKESMWGRKAINQYGAHLSMKLRSLDTETFESHEALLIYVRNKASKV